MILVDTSVLVRHLRSPSEAIRAILASADCAICGVTRAEILHGSRTPNDAVNLRAAIAAFTQLPIFDSTWDRLGDHLALLRSKGLAIPFQDVLIASVAIENDAELWSYDARFRLIQDTLTGLKLFDGPTA